MNSKIFTNKKNKLAMNLTLAASCLGLIASQPAAQAYGYSTPNIMGGYDYYFDGYSGYSTPNIMGGYDYHGF